MTVHVIAYDTLHPGDTNGLIAALEAFPADRIRRISLLAKTEGNSDPNDFSREYGLVRAGLALKAYGGIALAENANLLFSTGCEGAMTPFGYLIVDVDDGAAVSQDAALAIGLAKSAPIAAEDIGTPKHADISTETVRAAMEDAGVKPSDVVLVIVKTPVMSLDPEAQRAMSGTRISSGFSKAVGSLGAGVALGEVERASITPETIDKDYSLHARRVLSFSGSETDRMEVILFANKPGMPGDLSIHFSELEDVLDARGVRRMLEAAGLEFDDGCVTDPERVAAMLVKVGISPDGWLRGQRTTMRTSHLDMDKHLRPTMSGIVGSILGTPRTFISANTVHQAAPGGGLCACIVKSGAKSG